MMSQYVTTKLIMNVGTGFVIFKLEHSTYEDISKSSTAGHSYKSV